MTAKEETAPSAAQDVASSPITTTSADFDTAIDTAGFGIFNILLLLAILPAAVATIFEMASISFILPSAECDLKLTLLDEGILKGITNAGMITSAVFWGYLADTKGRKNLLVFGNLFHALAVLGGAFSQNKIQLMVFKYIGGFVMCGPTAVITSYLSEMHGKKYRDRVLMLVGNMFAIANVILPIIALSVLPENWHFEFTVTSWQIFLAITAIPSAIGGIFLSLFPESPKFLMSQQRNAEALLIFQKIFAMNKCKSRDEFPIKELAADLQGAEINENKSVSTVENVKTKQMLNNNDDYSKESKKTQFGLRAGLQQLRPLFSKPYLALSIQVYLMNFGVLLGQNTMRLWLPQLFASIEEYERNINDGVASMCTILEYRVNKTNIINGQSSNEVIPICEAVTTVASYTNNIIVALTSFLGYLVAGFVVNRIGRKHLTTVGLAITGTCAVLMYWSISSLMTLILASVFVTVNGVSFMSLKSSSVHLFPTSLRTMIVSLGMMFGRTGSVIGNLLFPVLMGLGCIPPFIMISFAMFFGSIMAAFLPDTNKAALK